MKTTKIDVVIPTFDRLKKLERLLASLENQTFKDFSVFIYFDNNDSKTYEKINDPYSFQIKKILNPSQLYVIGSWNRYFSEEFPNRKPDAVQWLVDDVELENDFLEKAYYRLINDYHDTDGVVGTAQKCPTDKNYTFKYFGQSLIGRKFIERYEKVGYKVCCPFYGHFYQDEEMFLYAKNLNRFSICDEAILTHYHPAFVKEEEDSTHQIVRGKIKRIDTDIYRRRREQNKIWGETFDE